MCCGGGTRLSANNGDTEWLPSVPGDRSVLLGTAWPGGTPWAVLVQCSTVPELSLLQLPAGHTCLRGPQGVGLALQTGAQTEPGAEKKDGKTQEKTHPLL